MLYKFKFVLVFLCLSSPLFGELSSRLSFEGGGEYIYYNRHDSDLNPENILGLEGWNSRLPITNKLDIFWGNLFSLSLDHDVSLGNVDSGTINLDEGYRFEQYPENQEYMLKEFILSSSLGISFLNLNVGKLIPILGVGYIRSPQSFFERLTDKKSKWMVNPQFFIEDSMLEIFYAPYHDLLPDDYTDKASLEDAKDIYGLALNGYIKSLYWEMVGFYDEEFTVGISSSSEIINGLLLYGDVVFSNKHWIDRIKGSAPNYTLETESGSYWDIMIGLNYSPTLINWSFYVEGRYNQDGLSSDEWDSFANNIDIIKQIDVGRPGYGTQYYSSLAESWPFNSLSQFSLALHGESFDYIKGLFKVKETVFISFPFGLMNYLTFEIPLWDSFEFVCTWGHVWDMGEYSYFLYEDRVKFTIKYKLFK